MTSPLLRAAKLMTTSTERTVTIDGRFVISLKRYSNYNSHFLFVACEGSFPMTRIPRPFPNVPRLYIGYLGGLSIVLRYPGSHNFQRMDAAAANPPPTNANLYPL